MKPSHTLRNFLLIAGSSLLAITPALHAASGTWNVDANGTWSTTGNWLDGIVADASTFTANFTNDITADRTVSLDSDRTLTSVVFGDSDTATAGSWILDNNGDANNNLILSGTGAGITVNGLGTGKTATVSAIIQGSAGLVKSGTGTLILSGANTYTGTTAVNLGTLQVNSGGTLGATTVALTVGTGADGVLGDAANLTINTNVQVAAFTVKSNTADVTTPSNINQLSIASGSTLTASSLTVGVAVGNSNTNVVNTALSTGSTPGAGGTLTVTGNTRVGLQGSNAGTGSGSTSVLDLRGLHTFNSGQLLVGNEKNSKGIVYLANNANTISGSTISVGDSSGTDNYLLAGMSQIFLGAGTNKLQATNLLIGKVKGAGQILFAGSSGSVEITGQGGIGTANILIGDHTATSYQGKDVNSLLLAGHEATVAAGSVILGRVGGSVVGGDSLDSLMTFDTGTFNATSIEMGVITSTGTTSSHPTNGTFTVGGDTANSAATGIVNVSGNILLNNHDSVYTGATSSTLTINGGTVNVNTTGATTGGIFDGSASTASTKTSTLTLAGGTLDLNGGRIGGVANTNSAGARNIDNLNFQSGTLIDVASINNNEGLTKTTSGTLNLDGTNGYTGGTSVTEGTLVFRKTTAKPGSGTHAFNAGTTLGLGVATSGSFFTATDVTNAFAGGTMTGNLSNVTVTATTNVGIDTTAGDFTYSDSISGSPTKGLTKLGTNKLTLSGTNTYTGATTVSAGTLYVTGALSNSAVTVDANGTVGSNGTAVTLGNGLNIAAGGNLDLTGATLVANTSSSGILTLTGGDLTLGNLTFLDIVGWDWANAAPGTYELIAGTFDIDWGTTAFLTPETAYDFDGLEGGNKGYFTSGSLNVVIIPEPNITALLGGLGTLLLLRRRRNA